MLLWISSKSTASSSSLSFDSLLVLPADFAEPVHDLNNGPYTRKMSMRYAFLAGLYAWLELQVEPILVLQNEKIADVRVGTGMSLAGSPSLLETVLTEILFIGHIILKTHYAGLQQYIDQTSSPNLLSGHNKHPLPRSYICIIADDHYHA